MKAAYELLRLYEHTISNLSVSGEKAIRIRQRIKELKYGIRGYVRRTKDSHIIKDNGIDGYIELVELPENISCKEEAVNYFEMEKVLHAQPRSYDCTGQAVTLWYKLFQRKDSL